MFCDTCNGVWAAGYKMRGGEAKLVSFALLFTYLLSFGGTYAALSSVGVSWFGALMMFAILFIPLHIFALARYGKMRSFRRKRRGERLTAR